MLSRLCEHLFQKPFAVEEIFHKRRAFFMSFFCLGFSSSFALDWFFRRNSGVDAGIIEIRIVIPPAVIILFRVDLPLFTLLYDIHLPYLPFPFFICIITKGMMKKYSIKFQKMFDILLEV